MSLRNSPWNWMRRQWAASGGGAPAGDTEAPTVPGNLAASAITTTTLTLTWDAATDNVDVLSYEIEYALDGDAFAWLATVAAPTVTLDVTGLTAGTAYRFRVLAEDAAGNLSGWGPDATGLLATTAAAFSFTDPTFNSGSVNAIIDDGSGGKYVGGSWTSVTCNVTATTYTTGYERLIHLLPTGEVDAAWSCPASSTVSELALDTANGVLFVGGYFFGATGLGGQPRNRLAAVTASTGVVDAGWVCDADDAILAMAFDAANDVLFVGGRFYGTSNLGGVSRNRLAAVTASTGVVVAGWVCDASSTVNAVAFDAANDVLFVGGNFNGATGLGNVARDRLGAVTASTGAVDAGWVCNANNNVNAVAFDAANDVLFVGGYFFGATGLGGVARDRLAAVTASTGVVDAGWVCDASSNVSELAFDAANDVLFVGGNFNGATGLGGVARDRLAAVTASTGVVDAGWVCDASAGVFALALDATSDALYVGGSFSGATGLDGAQRDRFGTVVASTGDLFIP
jgi:chitodextrinase